MNRPVKICLYILALLSTLVCLGGAAMAESSFTRYALTEDQLIQIARLCRQEQGSVAGAKAEASLMANQLETSSGRQKKYGTGADGLYNWVRNGGWFARAAYWMDNGTVSEAIIEGVRDVLVYGNRTLPWYVDEHDCLSDISSISTGDVNDKSAYVQGVTIVNNRYGSTWTFWCFPASNSDPFGYTQAAYNAVGGKMSPDDTVPEGEEMTSGYARTLPDGEYLISCSENPAYFLDIEGGAIPAANSTNVTICGPLESEPHPADIWSMEYTSDGFYYIRQKGTNMALTVADASRLPGANVRVNTFTGNSEQKWAIQQNGSTGYRLKSKVSGYSMEIYGGALKTGANIRQNEDHTGFTQAWAFIPYQPEQPIEDGRYVLLTALNTGYELDVPGDTGSIASGLRMQIWDIAAPSQYNSFDVTRLSNGFYTLTHAASGKRLDLYGAAKTYGTSAAVNDATTSWSQQWAIQATDGGGYRLVNRASGYCLNVANSSVGNGVAVQQQPYTGQASQRWYFVRAEITVTFKAEDDATNVPQPQKAYWPSTDVVLSSAIPEREGFAFLFWHSEETFDIYEPGETYSAGSDIVLMAGWQQIAPVLTLSAREITLTQYGETVELTAVLLTDGSCTDELVWTCLHAGDTAWDNSLSIVSEGSVARISAMDRTGEYVITCASADGVVSKSCTVTVLPAPVTSVELDCTDAELLVGESLTLRAGVLPDYTTLKDVTWSTSDPNVASVYDGVVTAVGSGTATITCASAGDPAKAAVCAVTVRSLLEGIDLDTDLLEFENKSSEAAKLRVSPRPIDATICAVEWTSDDPSVAIVEDGVVTPVEAGCTVIHCTCEGYGDAACTVVVHAESTMSLPAFLTTVGEESFYGSAAEEIILPEGIAAIEARAFADCERLKLISIPESTTEIAADAFEGSDSVTILCAADSYANQWAREHGLNAVEP